MNNREVNYKNSMKNGANMHLHEWWNWNPKGSNTWTILDSTVTSVMLENGLSFSDDIVGKKIVVNPGSSPPKLVDIDTAHRNSSSIYGMKFGINWGANENAFLGEFVPLPITHEPWVRQVSSDMFTNIGAHGVSQLINVQWSAHTTSEVLKSLKSITMSDEANGYSLSIMMSSFDYSSDDNNKYLYGKLVGCIGITKPGESLAFPANRVLMFNRNPPLPIPPQSQSCDFNSTNTAYFDIFGTRMTIDLSNSLALNPKGDVCHLFPYHIGILINQYTVEIIGEIPYTLKGWYRYTVGIQDLSLTSSQLKLAENHPIVFGTFKKKLHSKTEGLQYHICNNSLEKTTKNCLYIVMKESTYLVRPMHKYLHRLEKGEKTQVELKVKQFGHTPRKNIPVTLCDSSRNTRAKKSDLEYENTRKTNKNGLVTFDFVAGDVGNVRDSIDGQLFQFNYCVCEGCEVVQCSQCETKGGNQIVILIWSDVKYQKPYFWDKHIEPIFTQYQNLFPTMSKIIKLGNYDDVVKPQNIDLILFSMTLDVNHPSFMPVTRDLSPTKAAMIIDWLKTPDHPRSFEDNVLYEPPAFCYQTYLYNEEKVKKELAVMQIENSFPWMKKYPTNTRLLLAETESYLPTLYDSEVGQSFFDVATVTTSSFDRFSRSTDQSTDAYYRMIAAIMNFDQRGLPNWYTQTHCSKKLLKEKLQLALQLEFATIPPYLTALYSIKDGQNQEVYEIIRSVVMQEMLHLAQAANLLIAIGGRPIIDSPQAAPIYPGKLPGGVIPGLTITLQKASPKYIADVFMMIEFPHELHYMSHHIKQGLEAHVLTIGKLYNQIEKCMVNLYEKEKDNFFHAEAKQMTWPLPEHEEGIKLKVVTDIQDAIEALRRIVEEGEGSKQRDPTYLKTTELAHFFKFETLACKKHLRILHNDEQYTYDFRGKKIEFTSEGVWPMRNNPSIKTIPKNSLAIRESKLFHNLYRTLLKSLQAAFDGQHSAMIESVPIMEAMQLQAKKLMSMYLPSNSEHPGQTYGPIFEYEWPE